MKHELFAPFALLSLAPVAANADQQGPHTDTVTNGQATIPRIPSGVTAIEAGAFHECTSDGRAKVWQVITAETKAVAPHRQATTNTPAALDDSLDPGPAAADASPKAQARTAVLCPP